MNAYNTEGAAIDHSQSRNITIFVKNVLTMQSNYAIYIRLIQEKIPIYMKIMNFGNSKILTNVKLQIFVCYVGRYIKLTAAKYML